MMEMSGVRGVIVPCAGWLMSRWPMVTGQCVIVEGSHPPFSTNFNTFAFKRLLQKSLQLIFLAIMVEGHSRYCGWIRYILFDDA